MLEANETTQSTVDRPEAVGWMRWLMLKIFKPVIVGPKTVGELVRAVPAEAPKHVSENIPPDEVRVLAALDGIEGVLSRERGVVEYVKQGQPFRIAYHSRAEGGDIYISGAGGHARIPLNTEHVASRFERRFAHMVEVLRSSLARQLEQERQARKAEAMPVPMAEAMPPPPGAIVQQEEESGSWDPFASGPIEASGAIDLQQVDGATLALSMDEILSEMAEDGADPNEPTRVWEMPIDQLAQLSAAGVPVPGQPSKPAPKAEEAPEPVQDAPTDLDMDSPLYLKGDLLTNASQTKICKRFGLDQAQSQHLMMQIVTHHGSIITGNRTLLELPKSTLLSVTKIDDMFEVDLVDATEAAQDAAG